MVSEPLPDGHQPRHAGRDSGRRRRLPRTSGCTKVSPACTHCYAESIARRFPATLGQWGQGAPRRRTSAAYWQQPIQWNRDGNEFATCECGFTGRIPFESSRCPACDHSGITYRRRRVFVNSMSDWLDDEAPAEWLSDLLYLIGKTPQLDWLLLTKRPHLWRARMQAVAALPDVGAHLAQGWLEGNTFPNVWLGATIEDQARADERIPALLKIPARIRFLSCEPLLGPVDLLLGGECSSWKCPECGSHAIRNDNHDPRNGVWWECLDCKASEYGEAAWRPDIHWVIAGGESGPKARPTHPDWTRSLRNQCQRAGVPFLFKQWGEWAPAHDPKRDGVFVCGTTGQATDDLSKWDHRHCAAAHYCLTRVGKSQAGRTLDGRTWDEFPRSTAEVCNPKERE